MRIAMIGLGAIGQALMSCLAKQPQIEVAGALVAHPEKPRGNAPCPLFDHLDEVIAARPALVVECASQRAVREHAAAVLAARLH